MSDDTNLFGNGAFVGVNTNYSAQHQKTVFMLERGYDRFNMISDRTESNSLVHFLGIYKVKLTLNPSVTLTLRSYQKFTDVLAAVSSMLSTSLIVIAIFMNHYNSVQGKNNMIQSLYTHEGINKIKNFSIDLNETMKTRLLNKNVFFEINLGFKKEKKNF